ncbi:MAG: polysaccharide deacetylase, partial [Acetatifactor sp.]|nr:polysaccharide deacetylase [Acetatifactor sp.]
MKVYQSFPGGRAKALTMSYDDGKLSDVRLLEIFNRYGIKGTFNLNYGLMDMDIRLKPEQLPKLYQGHEIDPHTMTPPPL